MTPNEPLTLHLEKVLSRALRTTDQDIKLVGTGSFKLLANTLLSSELGDLPHLVVVESEEAGEKLRDEILFFDPQAPVYNLSGFDVSPYSSLYPNPLRSAERMNWLYHAQNAKPYEIFVAPIGFLLQKTLPAEDFMDLTQRFRRGDELPADLAARLSELGFFSSPFVSDPGQFSVRGGIVDIYSPAHEHPVRLELFGDEITSIRLFESESQRSLQELNEFSIIPPREIILSAELALPLIARLKEDASGRDIDTVELEGLIQALRKQEYSPGIEFLLPWSYPETNLPSDYFLSKPLVWVMEPLQVETKAEEFWSELKSDYQSAEHLAVRPEVADLFSAYGAALSSIPRSRMISVSPLQYQTSQELEVNTLAYTTHAVEEFKAMATGGFSSAEELMGVAAQKLRDWRKSGYKIFILASSQAQLERLKVLLERKDFVVSMAAEGQKLWSLWTAEQQENPNLIHLLPGRSQEEGVRIPEDHLVFLRDTDFFGRRTKKEYKSKDQSQLAVSALSHADLKVGDFIVHIQHGVGVFDGLKILSIEGVTSEYIQLKYKDNDRLYLPVYRVDQIYKFAGASSHVGLDKLGGLSWQKTKTKVRGHLKDIASELLALYAERSQMERPPFPPPDDDFQAFEASFPYDETEDQLRAIHSILEDLTSPRPMDRLVCGDVGFGKTEVAMRAAFKVVQSAKQVALLAPTTVLTYQHLETFRKRFGKWPIRIEALNRFHTGKETSSILQATREGKVDILIGTHRLLSQDVNFKNLGLLVVDEEQKFGVKHKERIKKLKSSVDTLALSATPIPRTLNMSLMGLRDLSIINTAPVDRLPSRTFVLKKDPETIRKAVSSEIKRGGQVYYIHNRVQSISSVYDELREILPEARIRVGHGQMNEEELEKTTLAFFNHEIDILLCTTIIESGIDNSRANTMFIDNAHQFGLSQLYQLRGRVGRGKERAFCYLLIPSSRGLDKDAQERLKVIQENTALGSGLKIAQYDLELRGSGDLLGESQSGHIEAVGYELYLELLEEAVGELRGEKAASQVEPEINVRISALIPDTYIPDVRIRLSYYRAFSNISEPQDLERYEEELRDQFGKPPAQVINLLGLMLIRHELKQLSVRDLSSGPKSIILAFTPDTPLSPQQVIKLVAQSNKKYALTPDSRLVIRINEITWPRIYEELTFLRCQVPSPDAT